jgi:DNA polymerase-1
MRDAIIARDNNKLVAVDFEQIEMRLLAHFCQDRPLIDAFGEEGDFFMNTARALYGDPDLTKDDPRRNVTKHASYAKVYGAGVPKFAHRADIPLDEAERFIKQFNKRFPGIQRWADEVSATALANYASGEGLHVLTEFGRIEVPESKDKLYTLVNYSIQGTAADIFKQTLLALDDAGLTDYLILPVHDECLFDVPEEDAEDVKVEAIAQFEKIGAGYTVPLEASGDVVTRWGDKYK